MLMRDLELPRRAGDLLLNTYFPGADDETRERARVAFCEWARVLEDLGARIAARQNTNGSIPVRSTDDPAV